MQIELKEDVVNRVWSEKDLSKVTKIVPVENKRTDFKDKKLNVGVYCRVSTDGIGQVMSFNLQKKHYIKYVRDNRNWNLYGLYSDEGKSATTTRNRTGLQMMLEDAKAGKIELIITKSISRLCRNLGDSVRIIRELRALERPVAIYFETEKMDTLNPNMELIINVLAIVAEEESKKKSEAITASCRARYEDGDFNKPDSLGYRRVGVNKIDIDEEEALTVRIIYDMFLSGYLPEEIASTLVELRRKKHTHICLNGCIKEGDIKWNEDSVLRVFENEKKCGDVLAQKTYTVDVLEHITRRNLRNVMQYYAVDQHPAIISREEFYLALKLKEANKYGWDKGLQSLRTYVSGPLRGYVLSVPKWNGFNRSDYMRASLRAYDIEIDDESLYPDHVIDAIERAKSGIEKNAEEKDDVEHFYKITDEDLKSDPEFTEEETKTIKEDDDKCLKEVEALRKLMEMPAKNEENRLSPISARMFYSGNKPTILFDRNGFKCNKESYERISGQKECIEVLFNPVEKRIIIRIAGDNTNDAVRLEWVTEKNGKILMKRVTARALTNAIYDIMRWDREAKYKFYGDIVTVDGKRCLSYSFDDPIIRVKYKKENATSSIDEGSIDISIENSAEDLLSAEEANDGSVFSGGVLYERGDNRSKAVLFEDRSSYEKDISINDVGEMIYDMNFIRDLARNDKKPIEGWGYLEGIIKWNAGGFELMRPEWKYSMVSVRSPKLEFDSSCESKCVDLGWTTEYAFPERAKVDQEISRMKQMMG